MKVTAIAVSLIVTMQILVIFSSFSAGLDPIPPTRDATGSFWEDDFIDYSQIESMGIDPGTEKPGSILLRDGWAEPGVQVSQLELEEETVALYHYNERSGDRIIDSGPYGINGTVTNYSEEDRVSGIEGYGLQINGKDKLVHAKSQSALLLNKFTLEAWIYPNNLPIPASCSGFIVHKRSGYLMTPWEVMIDTPSVVYTGSHRVKVGNWYYIVGTYDMKTLSFYVNGELESSVSCTKELRNYNQQLYMGGGSHSNPFYVFDGIMDEIRISEGAKSASEINSTYMRYLSELEEGRYEEAYFYSENISLPDQHYWEKLSLIKKCSNNTATTVSVIDPNTGETFPGYSSITASEMDLSGLDPLKYDSVQLKVVFSSSGQSFPRLDRLRIDFKENTAPSIGDLVICGNVTFDMDLNALSNIFDPDQHSSELVVGMELSPSRYSEWADYHVSSMLWDPSENKWNFSIATSEMEVFGYYDVRIRVVDRMGAEMNRTFKEAFILIPPGTGTLVIDKVGRSIFRGRSYQFSIIPGQDILFDDSDLTITATRDTRSLDWLSEPDKLDREWTSTISPPQGSEIGPVDIELTLSGPGIETVRVTVEDCFHVVNEPPWFEQLPVITIPEDQDPTQLIDLEHYINDNDSDKASTTLDISSVVPDGVIYLEVHDHGIDLVSLRENWHGTINAVISLSDDHDTIFTDLIINVTEVADPPVIFSIGTLTGRLGSTFQYEFSAYDPDENTILEYSIDLGHTIWGADRFMDRSTGELTMFLEEYMEGIHYGNLTVSDGTFTVTEPFTLEIERGNTPPVWRSVGSYIAYRDEVRIVLEMETSIDLKLLVYDDTLYISELDISVSGQPYFITMVDSNLLINAPKELKGEWDFTMTASDGEFTVPLTVTLVLTDHGSDPIAVAYSNRHEVYEGSIVTLTGTDSYDPDEYLGDELTYHWTSDISGYLGEEDVLMVDLEKGEHKITLTVTDSTGRASQDTIEILVKPLGSGGGGGGGERTFLLITIIVFLVIGILLLAFSILLAVYSFKERSSSQIPDNFVPEPIPEPEIKPEPKRQMLRPKPVHTDVKHGRLGSPDHENMGKDPPIKVKWDDFDEIRKP